MKVQYPHAELPALLIYNDDSGAGMEDKISKGEKIWSIFLQPMH